MKFNENKMKEAQEKALKILQENEDKSKAILEAVEVINEAQYGDIIKEITEEAESNASEKDLSNRLGLRVLSAEEKDFYSTLIKDPKQAVSGDQVNIMPTSIIDVTLEEVRTENPLLNLINFAPANVTKWISASKTGTFSWAGLTDKIKAELTAAFSALNMEVCKLTVYLILPKAIRDLALPYVDKYIRAVLNEQLNDGLEYGVLQGSGKNEPIGIYKQIAKTNEDGTHMDKEVNAGITTFSPKSIAPAKKYLSKNGKRRIDKIALVCHPNDEADYVAPAIYNDKGELVSSYKNLVVVTSPENPEGKAALMLPKKYTLGMTGFGLKDYDQTLALDDADVIIGKGYSNGRASDDNVAYIFDVTRLEEYVEKVRVINTVETTVKGTVETTEQVQGA